MACTALLFPVSYEKEIPQQENCGFRNRGILRRCASSFSSRSLFSSCVVDVDFFEGKTRLDCCVLVPRQRSVHVRCRFVAFVGFSSFFSSFALSAVAVAVGLTVAVTGKTGHDTVYLVERRGCGNGGKPVAGCLKQGCCRCRRTFRYAWPDPAGSQRVTSGFEKICILKFLLSVCHPVRPEVVLCRRHSGLPTGTNRHVPTLQERLNSGAGVS